MAKKTWMLFVLLLCVAAAASAQQKRLIGNLQMKPGAACSGSFGFKGQSVYSTKMIFYSSMGDETDTWMHIDGKDVRLRQISASEPTRPDAQGGEKVGSRTTEKYVGPGGIKVEILFRVAWLCAVNDPGCESIGYTATFKVRKGKRSQTVQA
jgi:hypothetical protein